MTKGKILTGRQNHYDKQVGFCGDLNAKSRFVSELIVVPLECVSPIPFPIEYCGIESKI